MEGTPHLSRRQLLKTGGLLSAGMALGSVSRSARAAAPVERLGRHRGIDPGRRILIRGAAIISMDDRIGDIAEGDILIEGTKIIGVQPRIAAKGARIIDAEDMIAIPGFVDCHRHAWEGQLRRINPNAATLAEYSNATHLSFAKHYRPEDMYAGNLLTAIGCIDAGITCVIDNSHNARSPAHSDAAVEALIDSGVRAVHASGAPNVQDVNYAGQWPDDLARLQKKYFSSDDQLVTLRMFSGVSRENWALARRLGLHISTEFQGPQAAMQLEELWREKLVKDDNTFNHCGALPESTWQILRDSGAKIDVCPRSDAQYGLGEGVSAFQHALDHDIRPGFSVDNETSYSGDMFAEMRAAFYMQRALLQKRRFEGETNLPEPVSVRDVLRCATMNGAACAGLSGKIGSISPGKEADLVLIRANDINLYPSNNVLGTVVQAADRSNIDTVIIGGRVAKFRGRLAGLDFAKLKRIVDESRNYLFRASLYKEDVFAATLPKLD